MFNITSQYPLAFAVLFLAIAVAAAVFSYRNTHLSRNKKYAMIAIRSISYFLLLALLLEPSILSPARLNDDTIDVVLIDNTRSNLLPGNDGNTKSTQINQLIDNSALISGSNMVYLFTNSIDATENVKDKLRFEGYETNLSDALKTLKTVIPGQPVTSITVISDGIITSGGNPVYEARNFQTAFNIIGIGDTIQKKDITVYNVLYNEKAFTGASTKIRVDLRSYESVNESVTLHLLREGLEVSSKNLSIKNRQELSEVSFDITESTPGFTKFRVYADGVNGELTPKNNYFDFIIEFLENKTNILFISSGPGYDNALVESIFKRIKSFNTTIKTAKNNTEFYEGAIDYRMFGELSAVFLFGFPKSGFSTEVIKNIAVKCKEFNIPVIFFAQKNTDYRLLEMFEDLIPFSVSRSTGESLTSLNIINTEENTLNKISGDLNSVQVFKNQSGIIQKPGSEVFITEKTGGEPVFITRNNGKSKSTAFLGYGLWRWRLNQSNNKESAAEKFILETINLSLIKDKKTRLRVYPVKSIFDYKESVLLKAEVYDEDYKLTTNAVVTANILSRDKKVSQKVTLNKDENIFSAALNELKVNDYEVFADAEINRSIYVKDNNRFIVDTLNTEFRNTRSDFLSMKELAQNTGGNFIYATDFSADKIKKIENPEPVKSYSHRNNLWENRFVLLFIIGLLTIEWVVKKRNNLP